MLLVPGFVSSGAVWDDVVAHYSARFECHVLTLAGFAGQPPAAAATLSGVRDEILAYVRARKLQRPVVVGHSMGGLLALWVAATAPDEIGPVVSVDGVPFLPALHNPGATPDSVRAQAEQLQKLYETMTPAQLGLQSRMAFAGMISDPKRVDEATNWAAASHPVTAGAMIGAMLTTDIRADVAAIHSPVLLVGAAKALEKMPGGSASALQTYEAQVRRIPRHEVVLATGALHFVMFDDLPFLLKAMDRFLADAATVRN
jgi:pimeloyl-ACP methyl ester carboxylesterase